jgi:hypothetical protein
LNIRRPASGAGQGHEEDVMTDAEPRSFSPIEVGDAVGLAYWAERLRTTPHRLIELVEAVGDNPKAVATELGVALLD